MTLLVTPALNLEEHITLAKNKCPMHFAPASTIYIQDTDISSPWRTQTLVYIYIHRNHARELSYSMSHSGGWKEWKFQ